MRHSQETIDKIMTLHQAGIKSRKIAKEVLGSSSKKSSVNDIIARYRNTDIEEHQGPKVLFFDIETAPVLGNVWGLFQQNVGLNQIHKEWHALSWAAKWMHSDEVMYEDQRGEPDVEDDFLLLQGIWRLLDQADIVVGHNSRRFDSKKLNARFILNGMSPPSHYRQIDTLEIAKRHFGFTSNKLAWLTDKLCENHKKMDHQKFAGFELWKECLAGNMEAWDEMELYNKVDVLSLEELYYKLAPWSNQIPNFNLYRKDQKCSCGSTHIEVNGYHYTNQSVFQRYRCADCGAQSRGKKNLLDKEQRSSQRVNLV